MLAIRLPHDVGRRLTELARRTGRSRSFLVREALLRHMEDLEDLALAEETLARVRRGEERTFTLDEVEKRLGLAD